MQTSRLILLDATSFSAAQPTGVELYARQLLPALTRALQQRGWLVGWIGHTDAPANLPEGAHWYYSPYKPFWSQRVLPPLLKALTPALYYTPSGIPPFRAAARTALTIHDLSVYQEPRAYRLTQQFRLKVLARNAAAQASCLIVPSQVVKRGMEKLWKISSEKIIVAGEGYTENKNLSEDVRVEGSFFLYVGRLEHKKNLLPLIAGFVKLANERACQLVLAGSNGVGSAQIAAVLKNLPTEIRARIVLPGYVTDGQKKWLYENALAGVLPSPHEGFGLPILDCFANSIPCLCAKAGALPEIGGQACSYAEADSPTDWYLQMRKLFDDERLRHDLVRKGVQQLSEYTWERTATYVAEALAKAATE